MRRLTSIGIGVAALLAGSATIGVAVATNPATAAEARSLLKPFGLTTCKSSNPCAQFNNNGTGPAIVGNGSTGEGVDGNSILSNGIRGTTVSPSKTKPPRSGVVGVDQSNDGGNLNVGVSGLSANGTGVEGTTLSSSQQFPQVTAGVEGLSMNGSSSPGVLGQSTGVASGAEGIALNPQGVGVVGSGMAGGDGVDGFSAGGPGAALYGSTNTGFALVAFNQPGNSNPAASIFGGQGNTASNSLVTYDVLNSATFWVDNGGGAHVRGLIFTGGPCSAGCAKTKDSPQRLVQRYTPQEAEPTIEDVGEAQLSDGSAYVRIDPAFANVMDRRATYLVFVTPQGLTRGLYVTNKTAQGFQVTEEPGGSASVAFDYRIVAKPFGQSAPRLPMIAAPLAPKSLTITHALHPR
jgi:hypothetical protein